MELLDTAKMEARREELGLSQEQAAARAGLAGRQHWNNIASARQGITLKTLAKVAAALEMEAADLIRRGLTAKAKRRGGK